MECSTLSSMIDSPDALTVWYNTNVAQLTTLTEIVRGNLSNIERRTIEALITADVHNRDTVDNLQNAEIDSVHDFLWV